MSVYTELSDYELFILLKAGNEPAFTEIDERYWFVLLRHARRMLQDEEEITFNKAVRG